MLTITQINYIRELYFCEGKTFTDICEMTGRNYRTVKRYIEMEDFNEKEHKADRPNKTDILRPIVNKWLTEDKARHHKQRHTAKRVYDRLKDEHPDLLEVSERTIRDLVREEKKKVYGDDKAYLPLEHPGGEAQVDFGTFEGFENGLLKKFHHLILSFPKTNAGFAVVARSQTREALLEGLVEIFKFIEYVPTSIWFDQMSAAALKTRDEKGRVKVTDFMKRFASHYGFKIKFCNPNSGNEKGNVENKVGTIRRNMFVPEPVIENLNKFNKGLLERCVGKNKEEHYRLKGPIEKVFEDEKSLMIPFNKISFDTARYESRRVNKYGLIEFEACRYSASPKFVDSYVTLKVMADEIEIYPKDLSGRISIHKRLFTKGEESINHIDFIDMLKVRPRALKYSGLYTLLPESWQNYLERLDKDSLKEAFNILKEILLEDDLDFADRAIKETLKHGNLSPEAIRITYKRLKENILMYNEEMFFPAATPFIEIDTSKYDKLIGGAW